MSMSIKNELKIINGFYNSLSTKKDKSSIYKFAGERIKKVFSLVDVEIAIYNDQSKIMESVVAFVNGELQKEKKIKSSEKEFLFTIISSHKPVLMNENIKDEFIKAGRKISGRIPKSFLAVPFISGGNIKGIISLTSFEKDFTFTQTDLNLVTALANIISLSLQSILLSEEAVILFEAEQQRSAELAIVNSVGEAMSKQLDVETVTKIIGDKVRDIFKAEATEILLLNPQTNMIHVPYSYYKDYQKVEPFSLGEGMTSKVINLRKPLLLNTGKEQAKYGAIQDEAVGEADYTESYLGVPIVVGEKVFGVVSVQAYKPNAYNENDVQLLSTLSTNMGFVIENARLFDETKNLLMQTQQRNAELGVINSVQEGLVAKMDIQGIYDLVGEKIREIFDAQVVSIGSYDYTKNLCHFKYDIEKGNRFYDEPRKFNGIDNYLVKKQKIILINNNFIKAITKFGMPNPEPAPGTEMPKSAIWVPLVVGKVVKGYVSLQNIDKDNAFAESDVRLLSTLANSMSVALENARLFDETNHLLEATKQQAAELAIINTVGEGLAQQLNYQAIIDLVGEKIREVFDAQVISISLYDSKKDLIHHRFVFENNKRFYFDEASKIDIDRKEIIESKKPLVFGTSDEIIAHSGEGVLAGDMPKSYMGVPINLNQEVTGVITVQDIDRENLYKDSDVRLLMTLASNMGVALENARLFEETNRLLDETKQRNAELGVINSVQEGLVAKMEMQAIYDLVGEKIRDIFDAQVTAIASFDHKKKTELFNFLIEKGERYYPESRPLDKLREHLILNRQTIYINENYEKAAVEYGLRVIEGTNYPKSLLFVPLIVGDKVSGYISLQNIDKENAFNKSDIRLLTTVANSMSVALENARLFNETNRLLNETQQRNTELAILNAIQQGLVMEMEFEGIINLVGDKLREALNFQDIGIRLYDKEKDLLNFPYEFEHGERLFLDPMPPTIISKYVLSNKKILLLKKNSEEEIKKLGIEGMAVIPGTDWSKSLVAVPILLGDEARGLILIENYEKEDAFSESDIRLLKTLSNSMSVALENARLFNETVRLLEESKQRTAELSTVNSISKALASHLELDKLINLVGDKMRSLFNANIVYVALYDKETNLIQFPYGYGDEFPRMVLGEGLTSQIIKSGEPLLLNKEVDERTAELGVERVGLPSASYLGVPIPVGKEIIGVISVQSTESENRFKDEDLRLLNTIAANVGVALNNAESYKQLHLTVEQLNSTLEDLKSTQKQLIVQEKLASLGQLTAGIAHEIKNPLNFVNNFAEVSIEIVEELREEIEIIKDKINADRLANVQELLKDLEENAKRINQHGKRADSIVRSMLQHSRGKAGEKQDSDINAMLEEDLNLAYHGMRARDTSFNITIEKNLDKNLKRIFIVPQDISRVFLNIINNGFYAANKKKKDNKNFSPTINISSFDYEDRIEVHIRDNGEGIPLEIQEKLFNPFFTTKPSGEGTGLGLSLSHDIIVKQHQGDIRFKTEPGEFTEFIITIPKNGK